MWPRCSIWWLASKTCAKNNATAARNAAQGMRRREIIGAMAISDALGFWPIFAGMVAILNSQHNAAVRPASVLGPTPNATLFQRSQSGFRPSAVRYGSSRKPRLDRFSSLCLGNQKRPLPSACCGPSSIFDEMPVSPIAETNTRTPRLPSAGYRVLYR